MICLKKNTTILFYTVLEYHLYVSLAVEVVTTNTHVTCDMSGLTLALVRLIYDVRTMSDVKRTLGNKLGLSFAKIRLYITRRRFLMNKGIHIFTWTY